MKNKIFNSIFSFIFDYNYDPATLLRKAPIVNNQIFVEKFKDAFLELDIIRYNCRLPKCLVERELFIRQKYVHKVISNILMEKYISKYGTKLRLKKIKDFISINLRESIREMIFSDIDKNMLENILEIYSY